MEKHNSWFQTRSKVTHNRRICLPCWRSFDLNSNLSTDKKLPQTKRLASGHELLRHCDRMFAHCCACLIIVPQPDEKSMQFGGFKRQRTPEIVRTSVPQLRKSSKRF